MKRLIELSQMLSDDQRLKALTAIALDAHKRAEGAMVFKGLWSAAKDYSLGQVVEHFGVWYVATKENKGQAPHDRSDSWITVKTSASSSKKGDPGEPGPRGLQGIRGKDGDSGKDGRGILDCSFKAGALEIVFSDGTKLTTPSLLGEQGKEGKAGVDGKDGVGISDAYFEDDKLTLVFTDGTQLESGSLKGEAGEKGQDGEDGQDGLDGRDGRGIEDVFIDRRGHLIVVFDDGTRKDAGLVKPRTQVVTSGGSPAYQPPTGEVGRSFFTTVDLVAGVPLVINHNLNLTNKNAFHLRAALPDGRTVDLGEEGVSVNQVRIFSLIGRVGLNVFIRG